MYQTALSFLPIVSAFQENPVSPGSSTAYQTIIQQIAATFSESNLVTVLGYAITGALILVFFWWAVRKCWKILSKAFFRGKLRF